VIVRKFNPQMLLHTYRILETLKKFSKFSLLANSIFNFTEKYFSLIKLQKSKRRGQLFKKKISLLANSIFNYLNNITVRHPHFSSPSPLFFPFFHLFSNFNACLSKNNFTRQVFSIFFHTQK